MLKDKTLLSAMGKQENNLPDLGFFWTWNRERIFSFNDQTEFRLYLFFNGATLVYLHCHSRHICHSIASPDTLF